MCLQVKEFSFLTIKKMLLLPNHTQYRNENWQEATKDTLQDIVQAVFCNYLSWKITDLTTFFVRSIYHTEDIHQQHHNARQN